MKKPAVIIDLDGTMCDIEHRRPLISGKKKNFTAFHDALGNDKLNLWCREIYWLFSQSYSIIFVTGRPEEYRDKTCAWLSHHGIVNADLYMRPTGDYRKDAVIKTEIYNTFIQPNYEVLFCVDDRQQVVDAWRELGLVCLQCAKGDY